MQNELIKRAVELAGGQCALARLCGKRQGHVSFWLRSPKVSAEVAVLIEAALDGAISKEEFRPDIFGPAPVVTARNGKRKGAA